MLAFRLVQRAIYRIIGDRPTSRHLALCLPGNIEILFSQSSNQGTIHAFPAPMMADPALAALLGLDATLVLIALVSSSDAAVHRDSAYRTIPPGDRRW